VVVVGNSSTDPSGLLPHAPTAPTNRTTRMTKGGGGAFGFLLKLLGLDRFTLSNQSKALQQRHSHSHSHSRQHDHDQGGGGGGGDNPFDLGFFRNCLDFWTKGGQLKVDWCDPNFEIPIGGFRQELMMTTTRTSRRRRDRRGGTSPYERVRLEEV